MDIFPDVFLILLFVPCSGQQLATPWPQVGRKSHRLLSFFKLYHDNTFSSGLGVGI